MVSGKERTVDSCENKAKCASHLRHKASPLPWSLSPSLPGPHIAPFKDSYVLVAAAGEPVKKGK